MRFRTGVTLAVVGAVTSLVPDVSLASANERPEFDRIVTVGDSYSSGLGIHADASDYDDHGPPSHSFTSTTRLGGSACHRELDATPGALLAEQLDARSVVVACAGAVIDDIANQLDAAGIRGSGMGTLIHLTVGGNDIRTERGDDWPTALVRCITSRRCDRSEDNGIANLDDVARDLNHLYVSMTKRFPEATVRVLGYPRLMQRERWGCPGVTGVGRSEADWIDDRVDELNDAIASAVTRASAATRADIRFVPVVDEFDNHGSCRFWQRDRYVNDAVFGETYSRRRSPEGSIVDHFTNLVLTISGSSFHPSHAGYAAYTRALAASI